MTNQERQAYNREYYKNRREQLLNRSKERYNQTKSSSKNVIPLFADTQKVKALDGGTDEIQPGNLPAQKKGRPSGWFLGIVSLQLLVAGMTYFLVSETAQFYALYDGGSTAPWLKAVLLEGSVLAFSLIRSRTKLGNLYQKTMIFLIYSFSVWVVSATALTQASHDHRHVLVYGKMAAEIEREISLQTNLRDSLLKANRISMSMNVEKTLIGLREKLEKSREMRLQKGEVTLIWSTLLSLILFRVLIMGSNLFCLQELKRRYLFLLKPT